MSSRIFAQEAFALSPARAYAIANAIRTLIWATTHGKGVHFHGPGDCDNPANHCNSGGPINAPCT